eukprot:CAMPEP_0201550332 /NCGR_PEP_ID=MMETSP0173_2-20130828/6720_1 /ASSEMBLY_ACC=CAM_ASM_000268 /TAXON_ID=218659 /ORGANISM="Vexillifera sp., Strain DIVA3 564/2" /LENGTH=117 /DNA_ID=CAMNT_0047960275 /DNA_START=483 /DNA_END=833 /DNA_ORIENTATION=+
MTDKYKLNQKFQNKRIKLNATVVLNKGYAKRLLSQKSSSTNESLDNQEMEQTIRSGRRLYIQAAIVRIMKAKRTLEHKQLMNAVLSQSMKTFCPTASMIKASIEQLIDNEFIQRQTG